MTTRNAPAEPAITNETTPASRSAAAPPSWPWRRSALLLAIAPAPLAAVAVFAPVAVARLAVIVAAVVVAVGTAGAVGHTGLFFVPALVSLVVGTVRLWREKPATGRG